MIQPHGGARGEVRHRPKSVKFIVLEQGSWCHGCFKRVVQKKMCRSTELRYFICREISDLLLVLRVQSLRLIRFIFTKFHGIPSNIERFQGSVSGIIKVLPHTIGSMSICKKKKKIHSSISAALHIKSRVFDLCFYKIQSHYAKQSLFVFVMLLYSRQRQQFLVFTTHSS